VVPRLLGDAAFYGRGGWGYARGFHARDYYSGRGYYAGGGGYYRGGLRWRICPRSRTAMVTPVVVSAEVSTEVAVDSTVAVPMAADADNRCSDSS